MKITDIRKYLDMTTVWHRHDDNYVLTLKDMSKDNRILFSTPIGVFHKPRDGTLNLFECHSMIYKTNHNDITNCHDPITDAIYARCRFNYIIKKMKQSKLYAPCSDIPIRERKYKYK